MYPAQACVFSIDHIIYKQSLTESRSHGPNYFLLPQSVNKTRSFQKKESRKQESDEAKVEVEVEHTEKKKVTPARSTTSN